MPKKVSPRVNDMWAFKSASANHEVPSNTMLHNAVEQSFLDEFFSNSGYIFSRVAATD